MHLRLLVHHVAALAFILNAFAHPTDTTQASRDLLPRATVCNGFAELCDRSFGSVTFVGTHNSYAIGVNMVAANQDQPITTQLNDGVRMLQMQAHNKDNTIQLCHTGCDILDGGTLVDYLKTVKTWLDSNPNEVLSLLIVNIDNMPATAYDAAFKAAGVDTISFVPDAPTLPASAWPSLGSMIDSGKRLVTFIDNQADSAAVPYLIDEFSNIWETAFNVIDPNFDCQVNRTRGDVNTQMYLINHFLDKLLFNLLVPDIAKLPQTNAASGFGSLGAHVTTCVGDHGRPPNFLLVDYYEFGGGSVFQVAADINKVPYNPATPVATPKSTSTTTNAPGQISTTSRPLGGADPVLSPKIYSLLVTALTLTLGHLLIS